ncbi:winged helix-turn-helix transcriptional regulator [Kiloniella antarctica]|uniref:Winged helix-turn-helix transcriptional regulator n=1 Tax=Kiloniella antarctica TaxID=1550907 RepID=A0ABW5BNM7_9PROT
MTSIPTPGTPVRGSKSGDPIMALFDLLGRRWAMGILWTLCKTGPCTFRELQANCGSISPTVLNTRLKELRLAQLISHQGDGYQATPMGKELYNLLLPIGGWSGQWAHVLAEDKDKQP